MKKLLAILVIFCFTISCIPDTATDDGPGPGPISEGGIELELITGTIIIPENSNISTENLTVSTFIDESEVSNDSFNIKIAKNEHNTIFVTDEFEKVIFLGYTYPGQTNHVIDASSTTLALLMNLPFVTMLSPDAKSNFVQELILNDEYPIIVTEMANLISGGISPLNTEQEDFAKKLLSLFANSTTNKNLDESDNPVAVFLNGKDVLFNNPGKSYDVSIGVYKNNERVDILELNRVLFVATSSGEVVSNINLQRLDGFEVENVKYSMESDGFYDFKIRNGFQGDASREDVEAYIRNIAKMALDIFLANPFKISKNVDCVQDLLNLLINISKLAPSNSSQFDSPSVIMGKAYDILISLTKTTVDTLPSCVNIKPSFGKLLGKLFIWEKLVNAFGTIGNLTVAATQLATDNSAMDLCYDVKGNVVENCERIILSGDINYEEVVIGEEAQEILTIRNDLPITIEVSKIDLPDGFEANWNSGTIEAGQEIEVTIYFKPKEKIDYAATITLDLNNDELENPTFELKGKGVQKKLDIEGSLDFVDASINTQKQKILKLKNNNKTVAIEVTSIDIPEGFELGWTEGTIEAQSIIEIIVDFLPTEIKDYSGELKINSDSDPYNNTLAINGKGINTVMELQGNLDFGEKTIDGETSRFFDIVNTSTTETITVTEIQFEVAPENMFYIKQGAWSQGAIPPNSKQEVEIIFNPKDDIEYTGNLTVINDKQETQNTIQVIGKGIRNTIRLVVEGQDFGDLNFGDVAINDSKTLLFEIQNPNLNVDITISNIILPEGYTADWTSGIIESFKRQLINVTFSPQTATDYNGVIQVDNNIDDLNNKISISGNGIDNNLILGSTWIPTTTILECTASPISNNQDCSIHNYTRPFVFLEDISTDCTTLECGELDFSNFRNGNSDGVTKNVWQFDGTTISIEINSSSNGYFFDTRTFTYTGTLSQDGKSFSGDYRIEYKGGLWRNLSLGTMILTKE